MNRLLSSLPPDDFQRVSSELTWRPLKVRQVLHKHGEPLAEVYFPGRSVCSITNVMEDGSVVEVATVGSEGLVGISAVFGAPVASGEAFVQIAAEPAAVMSIDAFRREMERRGAFYDRVTKYSQAFVNMLMQSVACNGLHSAEQRCCRWLLTTHDRIGQDEFPLTHEFLAIMLGVRRPTVTLVMAELARAGVVSHVRGHVRIVDRKGLEKAACECYRNVRTVFDRLLGVAGAPRCRSRPISCSRHSPGVTTSACSPLLRTLHVTAETALPHCGHTRVYFPGTGLCSIINKMADGGAIEVACIGNEGVVGLHSLADEPPHDRNGFVQVADGTVQYLPAVSLRTGNRPQRAISRGHRRLLTLVSRDDDPGRGLQPASHRPSNGAAGGCSACTIVSAAPGSS